jgi:hypothetical protein
MKKKYKFTIKENIYEQNWIPSPVEIERQKKEEEERDQQQDQIQLPNPDDEASWHWNENGYSSTDDDTEEKRGIEIIDLYGEGKLRLRDLLAVRPALVSPHLFGFNGKAPRKLSEAVQINEGDLAEGGYTKLMRSLTGQEQNISSIGIITAENPFAKELPGSENKSRNKQLAQALRQAGYGFYQIQGKYGNIEKPLVIPNIDKEDLLFLGKKFEQESVIFVQKLDDSQMKAELLYTDGSGNAAEPRSVVLPVAQDQDDFYSIYKGRKFVIPFFNDLFSGATMSGGKVNYPEKTEES